MPKRKRDPSEEEVPEANLIPVMNVMLLMIPALLLSMEVARLSGIMVSPPKFAATANEKQENKDQKPLNLKVFIMFDGYRVSASGQQEGAEAGKSADSSRPTIPLAKPGTDLLDYDRYDYAALEAESKRFKSLFPHETVVTISAENDIPMQSLVRTMDSLRGTDCKLLDAMSKGEDVPPECLFWQTIIEAGAG
jgi:biopolymer transport protein ExbD